MIASHLENKQQSVVTLSSFLYLLSFNEACFCVNKHHKLIKMLPMNAIIMGCKKRHMCVYSLKSRSRKVRKLRGNGVSSENWPRRNSSIANGTSDDRLRFERIGWPVESFPFESLYFFKLLVLREWPIVILFYQLLSKMCFYIIRIISLKIFHS